MLIVWYLLIMTPVVVAKTGYHNKLSRKVDADFILEEHLDAFYLCTGIVVIILSLGFGLIFPN